MSIRNDLEDAFNEGYAKGLKEGRRFAEPVVRCKDCKHSFGELATRGGVWSTDDKHMFCQMTKHLMRVDDFCSWGERRKDGK